MPFSDLSSSSLSSENENIVPQRRRRNFRHRIDPMVLYDDQEFLSRYRLSKHSVQRLKDLIGDEIEPKTLRNKSISVLLQILITLRFFATGSFQQQLGDSDGYVSKATVCRIIKRITHCIASLRPMFIKPPVSQEERQSIKFDFFLIRGFPGVIGAIDCTHIKLQRPRGGNGELFRNRKGFFSINTQVVCDAKKKIWNIVARWPGSAHDSTIFRDSALCADLENGRFGSDYLLGDKGYACSRILLTPFQNPRTAAENAYNLAHAATRNPVECCFGILKRRFPVLSLGLRLALETNLTVIVACAVLHNLAIELADDVPDDINAPIEMEIAVPLVENRYVVNGAVRRSIVETFFS